jgi:hypothetical protein
MTFRTSSTLFKSDVHLSLLSEANFISLACLRATFLFPEFKEANADFLDLHREYTESVRQENLFQLTYQITTLKCCLKNKPYEIKM